MPEIAEVYRLVHYLKKHLVNRKIGKVHVQDDPIVYGKVGCTAEQFQSAMTNKTVVDVKQQGKYFWLEMSSPPHALLHLGMTGWVEFSNDENVHYRPKPKDEEWPPRFWKFRLETAGTPECEVAFVDARRLGRIRLVDVAAGLMRKTTPLKENGPDPVIDKDIFTQEWLQTKLRSKRVPVKALLLDQANISGIGNWVADEVLYQARIHPEQYSNTFTDEEINRLYSKIIEVCETACDLLAESSKFPENWLMRHRWDKGKKDANVLPNGEKIIHIKVGGRTSAVVPSVQKKTGPVAGETVIDEANTVSGVTSDSKAKTKKGKVNGEMTPSAKSAVKDNANKNATPAKGSTEPTPSKSGKRKAADVKEEKVSKKVKEEKSEEAPGRRRSTRAK